MLPSKYVTCSSVPIPEHSENYSNCLCEYLLFGRPRGRCSRPSHLGADGPRPKRVSAPRSAAASFPREGRREFLKGDTTAWAKSSRGQSGWRGVISAGLALLSSGAWEAAKFPGAGAQSTDCLRAQGHTTAFYQEAAGGEVGEAENQKQPFWTVYTAPEARHWVPPGFSSRAVHRKQ